MTALTPEFVNIVGQFVRMCFLSDPPISHRMFVYTMVYEKISVLAENWRGIYDCLQAECRSLFRENKLASDKVEQNAKTLAHAFAYVDRTKNIVCNNCEKVKPVFEMIMSEFKLEYQK